MDNMGFEFLKGVVGPDGARALEKAAERAPSIAPALVPRAIVSWLTANKEGYEGALPGVEGSYFMLVKSEAGYSGVVAAGDSLYAFEAEPFVKVAAGLSVILGVDVKQNDSLRKSEMGNLGKSVDRLVFAESAKKRGKKDEDEEVEKVELPGQAAKPRGPKPPEMPEAPRKQARISGPKPMKGMSTGQPMIAKGEVKLNESEMAARCPVCGHNEFEGERFVGCACLKKNAQAGDFTLVKNEDGQFTFSFGMSWSHDAISKFLTTVKR